MGSYSDRKAFSLQDKNTADFSENSTKASIKKGLRHNDATLAYSTKDQFETAYDVLDDQLSMRTTATVESDIQSYIDHELQLLHDELMAEPVPERFQLLLDTLESKKEKGS